MINILEKGRGNYFKKLDNLFKENPWCLLRMIVIVVEINKWTNIEWKCVFGGGEEKTNIYKYFQGQIFVHNPPAMAGTKNSLLWDSGTINYQILLNSSFQQNFEFWKSVQWLQSYS